MQLVDVGRSHEIAGVIFCVRRALAGALVHLRYAVGVPLLFEDFYSNVWTWVSGMKCAGTALLARPRRLEFAAHSSDAMMKIEIFSDIACPWCFIGKRRLERALLNAGSKAELGFRAFQLQPGLPTEGVPAEAFFERKFGGTERVRAIFERVTEVGRADGIHFDFHKQQRAPNTELAHRVVRFASSKGQATRTVEALFSGYFEQGVDVGELSEIVRLLDRAEVAIDGAELLAALAAGFGRQQVANDLSLAREYGIGGVPLFIFDQRYSVEGAQPVKHFEQLIRKLLAEDSPHLRAQSAG